MIVAAFLLVAYTAASASEQNETISPFGRQIGACFPVLPKLVQATKERQAQRKEQQQKHGEPACEEARLLGGERLRPLRVKGF